MLKVALLCHFPAAWFERHGVRFDPAPVAGEISSAAFSTLEGILCMGLAEHPGIDLHVVTFSKAVTVRQTVTLGTRGHLHVLPARPLTGMVAGWLPRRWAAHRLLRELKPDVVHGLRNLEGYGSFAASSGYPHVVTTQEFLDQIPVPPDLRFSFLIGRWMERATLKKARHLIATTEYVERWLRSRSTAKIFRVPNIADDSFYKVTKVADPRGVLFVGRIAPEKGLLDFLKALEVAKRKGCKIEAKIVGGAAETGGGYYQECQDFARAHLEKDQVTFLGWRTSAEIAQLQATSALFVMPSLAPYETMGIVLAEALAAGTPAVVYDFGPMPGMIQHEKTGLVMPPGDVEAMAQAMIDLWSDAPKREAMSGRARQAAEPFRRSAVVEAHWNVYKMIAAESSRNPS